MFFIGTNELTIDGGYRVYGLTRGGLTIYLDLSHFVLFCYCLFVLQFVIVYMTGINVFNVVYSKSASMKTMHKRMMLTGL